MYAAVQPARFPHLQFILDGLGLASSAGSSVQLKGKRAKQRQVRTG